MSKKKIILIIVVVVVVLLAAGIYYVARGGFTGKQRYENCMEACYDLLLMDSSKQYCSEECTEVTGYNPEAAEEQKLNNELKNVDKKTNTNTTNANTSTTNANIAVNTASNINSSLNRNTGVQVNANIVVYDYENLEYYCEWSWPQKIIDMETKDVIKACTSSRPWCNRADGTYENVGCCADRAHTNCLTVAELIQ